MCEDCSGSCSGGCDGGCSSCSGGCDGCSGCTNACTGCTGSCDDTCHGACESTCNNGCKDACLNTCTTNCRDTCKTSCFETCKDNCYWDCNGVCRGYCAEDCQSYCETKEVFTENLSSNGVNNPIGKPKFYWSHDISVNKTIIITAKEWNTLKSYIKTSTEYCGGTAPSRADVYPTKPITASDYNDLANGLNLPNATADVTLITSNIINILSETYNERKMKNDEIPSGKYPITHMVQNDCCQSAMTCVDKDQVFNPYQIKLEACEPTTLQIELPCGDQTETPGPST